MPAYDVTGMRRWHDAAPAAVTHRVPRAAREHRARLPAQRRARGAAQDRRGVRPRGRRAGDRRRSTSATSSPTTSSARWARWGCSACRSRRSTAAWAATTSRSASRSRSWPGSTRRSRSRWRRPCRSARCRSTGSAPRSRSASGCRGCAAGEALGAFGLTEPGGGLRRRRDPRRPRVLDGDEWVINGTKAFITNSGTDITGARHRHRGDRRRPTAAARRSPRSSCRPARRASPCRKKYSKVGWNASDTRELSFADCRVPGRQPARRARPRLRAVPAILDEGRIAIAALGVGLAQGCVDESVQVRQAARGVRPRRSAPTRPSQFKIADMEMRAHTARLAYYDAAARMLRGEPFKRQAAIAKLLLLGDRGRPTPARRPRSTAATAS